MQIEQIITHEAQLGEQLCKSVATDRQSDFAFLLAMLSHDATEFSQFNLPQSEKELLSDPLLEFAKQGAGPKKPLAVEPFNGLIGQQNCQLLIEQGINAIHLNECLNPEPFTCKNDTKYISPVVIDNCPPATQKKLIAAKNVALTNKKMDIDGFYSSIEKSQNYDFASVA
ncbi:VC2046/SO_2500 family protein [Pseudoalteromonas sp. G4]|uniref:VC2046/SO_2500 family protein n=1 Tax=Pseudoalteromonas sp. G4 TaxID=2992761 RepID=UPI00237D602A|nr:VC2046/SO_2500 family protein [Pseudoalteromonas sp. G4]MDE3270621.1 VC2046/SO_2500 family protein [Pseudoalteromonas sp. G4]